MKKSNKKKNMLKKFFNKRIFRVDDVVTKVNATGNLTMEQFKNAKRIFEKDDILQGGK